MANVVEIEKLIFFDIADNHNKLWFITLFDDGSLKTSWGRAGSKLTDSIKPFGDNNKAKKEFDKLVKSKLKKGYTKLETESTVISESGNTSITTNITQSLSVEDLAINEIVFDKNDSHLMDLIKRFCSENIHNITNNTNITYSASTGLFQTPGGIVTREAITKARVILDKIQDFYDNGMLMSDEGKSLVENYCRIIPTKVPGKTIHISKIFPNTQSFDIQRSVLDSLEDSIDTIEQIKNNQLNVDQIKKPKVFNVSVKLVEDNSVIKDIITMFNSTRQNIHACRDLRIKNVYEVCIDSMDKNYKALKEKWIKENHLLNEMRLWHGTRTHNIISIFKCGLVIPPSNAKHVVGRMFGDGLYFSDQSTKSLNYSYGYWNGGSRSRNCFMFLCDVLMGKTYTPYSSGSYRPSDCDSIYAEAHKSGVMNNEMIVPKTAQANIRYLIEFE